MKNFFDLILKLLQNPKIFNCLGRYLKIHKFHGAIAQRFLLAAALSVIFGVASCSPFAPAQKFDPSLPPETKEIVFCNYADDMPQPVLDDFTAETRIRIHYQTFDSMEEAVQIIQTKNTCDVVNLDNRYISELAQAGLLAKLTRGNLPNLKNISANFRDMVYDPHNSYTVPYNWGTSGLLFRSDLVQVTSWKDLWNPNLPGKIGLWRGEPRDGLGLALKSLGFSVNSENPSEVNAAADHLIKLGSKVLFLDDENQAFAADYLKEGKVVVALAWAADAIQSREINPAIQYLLPEEGAMLWGENFVIPNGRPNQTAAESFLNFLLRPQIAAKIANLNSYATPNQAAFPFIKPEILNDPIIFPSNELLLKAEIILTLSPQGQKLYDEAWERFLETQKKP